LWRDCSFFPDDGQCASRSCAVDECGAEEFFNVCHGHESGNIDASLDPTNFQKWVEDGDPWTNDADVMNLGEHMNYVDLMKNPERYTGYSGQSATRIWKAIYDENCFVTEEQTEIPTFSTPTEQCVEKRVFYRLVSGLHSSITTHLAHDFSDDLSSLRFYPNVQRFYETVGMFPSRIHNMYLTYLMLLRAVSKALPTYLHFDYQNGQAAHIQSLISQLASVTTTCPNTFDENTMFQGKDALALKTQFKNHFRNISVILDCVACERCKLWGKLQINGLGTALKILFDAKQPHDGEVFPLERTELVALIHTFRRLSESLKWSNEMFQQYAQSHGNTGEKLAAPTFGGDRGGADDLETTEQLSAPQSDTPIAEPSGVTSEAGIPQQSEPVEVKIESNIPESVLQPVQHLRAGAQEQLDILAMLQHQHEQIPPESFILKDTVPIEDALNTPPTDSHPSDTGSQDQHQQEEELATTAIPFIPPEQTHMDAQHLGQTIPLENQIPEPLSHAEESEAHREFIKHEPIIRKELDEPKPDPFVEAIHHNIHDHGHDHEHTNHDQHHQGPQVDHTHLKHEALDPNKGHEDASPSAQEIPTLHHYDEEAIQQPTHLDHHIQSQTEEVRSDEFYQHAQHQDQTTPQEAQHYHSHEHGHSHEEHTHGHHDHAHSHGHSHQHESGHGMMGVSTGFGMGDMDHSHGHGHHGGHQESTRDLSTMSSEPWQEIEPEGFDLVLAYLGEAWRVVRVAAFDFYHGVLAPGLREHSTWYSGLAVISPVVFIFILALRRQPAATKPFEDPIRSTSTLTSGEGSRRGGIKKVPLPSSGYTDLASPPSSTSSSPIPLGPVPMSSPGAGGIKAPSATRNRKASVPSLGTTPPLADPSLPTPHLAPRISAPPGTTPLQPFFNPKSRPSSSSSNPPSTKASSSRSSNDKKKDVSASNPAATTSEESPLAGATTLPPVSLPPLSAGVGVAPPMSLPALGSRSSVPKASAPRSRPAIPMPGAVKK
jgi:hypothetical protein